jgi:MerR family transcriptional regulator, copper efflux regulator
MDATSADLVPIDEVARRLGMRASAIRYYEQCGLIEPAARRSGRRWYGAEEVRRLAIIRYWQESALMSLEDIGDLLAARGNRWREVIADQLEALGTKIERMEVAREFLAHVSSHHDSPPDGCPHYEAVIWERIGETAGPPVGAF